MMLSLLVLAQLQLPDVLRALGDDAERREAAGPCSYHESTTVEELADDGSVKGSEQREYDAVMAAGEVTKRERLSVKATGAPLADLLSEPKNAKGRKPARSPFVSALRPQFKFALEDGPSPELVKVTLEPLKPDPERPRGEAWVRRADLKLVELRLTPSKTPMLLDSMALRFVFDDTGCGRAATLIETQGAGAAPLLDTKFRSRTVLSKHAKAKAP
ncbi:MAG: hypothetical protein IPJ65_00725 [Archangiaceae bacterium]|nr:hypothetical protein [Archangiaceae bacterium]